MSYLITFSTPAGTTRRAEPDLPAARLWITRNMPQDLREQADNLSGLDPEDIIADP